MKTLLKIKCYFKSIWMAILGKHWYEKRWLRYDKKFMKSIGQEDCKGCEAVTNTDERLFTLRAGSIKSKD